MHLKTFVCHLPALFYPIVPSTRFISFEIIFNLIHNILNKKLQQLTLELMKLFENDQRHPKSPPRLPWLPHHFDQLNIHHTPEETYGPNKPRATWVVLTLDDEKSTLTIRAIFETIMPRKTYTASYGALRFFLICNFKDAPSFEPVIERRMFGKIPNAFSIY